MSLNKEAALFGRYIIKEDINETAMERYIQGVKKLGYDNVKVKVGDGFFGWKEYAPFDAIIITCAAPKVPPKLVEQLKDGGRILLPLGENLFYQNLTLVTKKNGKLKYKYLSGVVFVPMTGKIREEKEK